jgi:hypothetical protein
VASADATLSRRRDAIVAPRGYDRGVANRLTRIPDRPVPPLPGWVRPLVPLADAFMVLMVSRPRSGSLTRTWVTPATLHLCVALVVGGLLCALLAAGDEVHGGVAVGLIAGLLVMSVGAGAVALVGVTQRRG